MAVFLVTEGNGRAWDDARPRREQAGWDAHGEFMDRLLAEGFVILGGPLGDGEHALLAVEAADAAEVQARLAPDPWLRDGVLRIDRIETWTIWLDGVRRSG